MLKTNSHSTESAVLKVDYVVEVFCIVIRLSGLQLKLVITQTRYLVWFGMERVKFSVKTKAALLNFFDL